MKYIDYVGFTTVCLLTLTFVWVVVFYATQKTMQGDMNRDGELTIVDLSILAEEIRNDKP